MSGSEQRFLPVCCNTSATHNNALVWSRSGGLTFAVARPGWRLAALRFQADYERDDLIVSLAKAEKASATLGSRMAY